MCVGRCCVFQNKEQYTVMYVDTSFTIYLCLKCSYKFFECVFTHVYSKCVYNVCASVYKMTELNNLTIFFFFGQTAAWIVFLCSVCFCCLSRHVTGSTDTLLTFILSCKSYFLINHWVNCSVQAIQHYNTWVMWLAQAQADHLTGFLMSLLKMSFFFVGNLE